MNADHAAAIRREGETLHVEGALLRADIARLWRNPPATFVGLRRIDLGGVDRIDSAGLAMLSLIAAQNEGVAIDGVIDGTPEGLPELRAAYRLNDSLGFARD